MKRLISPVLAALLAAFPFRAYGGNDDLRKEDFKKPSEQYQVATWWHWMDGGITKDGIRKDLNAMKSQGISNATILNIYRLVGLQDCPQVEFGSDEWFSLFSYALQVADSLGIEIGAANCDGWSESGGPWITPETSMKQYTWRKTYIKGGAKRTVALQKPYFKERFYRDVKVVAYRGEKPNSFVKAAPSVRCRGSYPQETLIKSHKYHDETRHIDLLDPVDPEILIDGNPQTGLTLNEDKYVYLDFSGEFAADELQIYIAVSAARFPIPVKIEVSDDGAEYRTVAEVYPRSASSLQKLPFPRSSSKHWRLKVNSDLSATTLTELCLLSKGERGVYDSDPQAVIASAAEVVDLTSKMDEDGVLRWNFPSGDWTVIRFGYTSNGKFNHPASPQGVGLECDKMDTTALNIHFEAFPRKLIEAASDLCGKTFTYFLVDSWECGEQNWTRQMPYEFLSRRGYDLTAYIPVLCGERIASKELSDAFLYGFNRTRGELVLDYYFKHLSELCHRNGMKLYSEGIYGGPTMPPVDVLKSYQYCDVPMTEFWAQSSAYREWPIVFEPGNNSKHAFPYHAGLIYNKDVIASEAYTGMALYSDSPIDLKLYADQAYTQGVNRMVLHSYVHQPLDLRPGVTLGIYGQTFNRNNTWFMRSDGFFREQSRIQYVLQKGSVRADALVFIGDELPNVEMSESEIETLLPKGCKFQYINSETLRSRLSVKDSIIYLDGIHPFKFLALRSPRLELETASAIQELARGGALIYGPRPVSTLSLTNRSVNDKQLEVIAENIWDSGMVITDKRKLERSYRKDLDTDVDIDRLLYCHKAIDGRQVYYLVNKSNSSALSFEARFDFPFGKPQIWNPMDGSVCDWQIYRCDDQVTTVPLSLDPRQGVFVVLGEGGDRIPHVNGITDIDGRPLFPSNGPGMLSWHKLTGSFYASFSDCTACRVDVPDPLVIVLDGTVGTMTFIDEPLLGTRPIGGFKELTSSLDPVERHYSGEILYSMHFDVPSDALKGARAALMGIPAFGSTATIRLNGVEYESLWDPYHSIDVLSSLKEGDNTLEIIVTNPWRNRLIGDKAGVRSGQKRWTTSPLQQKNIPPQQIIHEYALLYPAGISRNISISIFPAINITNQ